VRHADGTLNHAITPASLPFVSLDDVDPDRHGHHHRQPRPDSHRNLPSAPARAPVLLTPEAGLHGATFADGNHTRFIDSLSGADAA
jgi:dipeptidyl-peptidase-4